MTNGFAQRAAWGTGAAGAASWARPHPAVRASDRAVSGFGALCFKAFLAAQFLSLTRLFFSHHLGDGVTPLASIAGQLSVALLLPAVVTYGLQSGSLLGTLVPKAHAWVVAVLALAVSLFLYGWLGKEYAVTAAAHDLTPYLVIVACVVLGSVPRAWKDSDRTVLVLFAAALLVNAVGMTEITTVVSEDHAEDREGIATLAYRTQGALAFWPLLLLTARLRRPPAALLVFAGVCFVLAQQVLFQKRAPTLRVALFMLVFLVVLPRLQRRRSPRRAPTRPAPAAGETALRPSGPSDERWIRRTFAATLVVAVALALSAAPWLFRGQATGLVNRLSGQSYSGGATGMLSWENERFFEVGMFLRTLERQELVFGRGFGGHFVPDAKRWGAWQDDVNDVARRQLHVGALMPFFKGGLVLAVVYYAGLAFALRRGRRALAEPFAAAAFFVVLLHALFLLQEGWFIMSGSFDLVVVGLCMGHLLSRDRVLAGERRLRAAAAFPSPSVEGRRAGH